MPLWRPDSKMAQRRVRCQVDATVLGDPLPISSSALLLPAKQGGRHHHHRLREAAGVSSLVQKIRSANSEQAASDANRPLPVAEEEPTSKLLRLDPHLTSVAGRNTGERRAHPSEKGVKSTSLRKSASMRRSMIELLPTWRDQARKFLKEQVTRLWQIVLARLLHAKAWAAFFGWLVLLATIVFIFMIIVGGNYLGHKFLVVEDAPVRGDPEYLVDFFGGKCIHLKQHFAANLLELEAFNRRFGWHTVVFPSREDGIPVDALYLPSPSRHAPRVVIAHPAAANNLDSTVQTVAYFLRLMNISVLLPNLRNHGGPGKATKRVIRWAQQHLDVLGAWDFAVSDPQGTLGGRVDPSLVGLLGFEFGGFAVQVAMAKEPLVPAIVLDGAVHNTRELLKHRMKLSVSEFLDWLFEEQAWSRWQSLQQRNLDDDGTVAEMLEARAASGGASGPGQRVGIIHTEHDTVVPIKQKDMMLQTLGAARNPPVEVIMEWYPSFMGGESCELKSESHLERSSEYAAHLCAFWSTVFDGDASARCRTLPSAGL